jgi:hypothetical protein
MIKPWKMRWAGHIALINAHRSVYKALVGKPNERDHYEYLGGDGSIILKQLL